MTYLDPIAGALRESRQVDAVDDLDLTASATYDETEVQAIADKVDELLAALRAAGYLAESEE